MLEIEVVTTKKKLTKSLLDQLPRLSIYEGVNTVCFYTGEVQHDTYWIKLPGRPKMYLINRHGVWRIFEDYDWKYEGGELWRSNYPFKSYSFSDETDAREAYDQYKTLIKDTANRQLFI